MEPTYEFDLSEIRVGGFTDPSGQVAVVTGAASGLGRDASQKLEQTAARSDRAAAS